MSAIGVRRKAMGLCVRCDEPAFRAGRCAAHYAVVLADNRARHIRRRDEGRPYLSKSRREHPDRRGRRGRAPIAGGPDASIVGWHVYALHDPDTDALRYVGLTGNPRHRWLVHKGNATQVAKGRRSPTPVTLWVQELLDAGQRPVMRVLFPAADEGAGRLLETETIQRFIAEGHDLLNVTGRIVHGPPTCGRCGAEGHKRYACPVPKKTNAEHCRERRARCRDEGCCLWCGGETNGHTRCDDCIQKDDARRKVRKAAKRAEGIAAGLITRKCRGCGEVGHNRTTCPNPSPPPAPPVPSPPPPAKVAKRPRPRPIPGGVSPARRAIDAIRAARRTEAA